MNVTVCELPTDPGNLNDCWRRLARHTRAVHTDLVLLPEMPFHPWVPASPEADPAKWRRAVDAHRQWIGRLPELGAPWVAGTRPVLRGGRPYNEGFVWSPTQGAVTAHTKRYLPDETGFWEASWYSRGQKAFEVIRCGEVRIGFLICTELWFADHARAYGRQGAHVIVCPRVTPAASTDKWLAGGRTAAVVSGAYCLSSNQTGPDVPGIDFGGTGWIIEPEEGIVLGTTSPDAPFLTMAIDPGQAQAAKTTYPRYVAE